MPELRIPHARATYSTCMLRIPHVRAMYSTCMLVFHMHARATYSTCQSYVFYMSELHILHVRATYSTCMLVFHMHARATYSTCQSYVFYMSELHILHVRATYSTRQSYVFYTSELRILHARATYSTCQSYVFYMPELRILHVRATYSTCQSYVFTWELRTLGTSLGRIPTYACMHSHAHLRTSPWASNVWEAGCDYAADVFYLTKHPVASTLTAWPHLTYLKATAEPVMLGAAVAGHFTPNTTSSPLPMKCSHFMRIYLTDG